MKKIIALGGIAAMSAFGFIGLGATVASATTPPPTAKQTVCTSATAQLTGFAPTATFDANTLANEVSADTTANNAVGTAETAYITAAMQVISDVDASASAGQISLDTATFNASVTSIVNAAVAASNSDVIVFAGQKVVKADTLKTKVLNDFVTAACVPAP